MVLVPMIRVCTAGLPGHHQRLAEAEQDVAAEGPANGARATTLQKNEAPVEPLSLVVAASWDRSDPTIRYMAGLCVLDVDQL